MLVRVEAETSEVKLLLKFEVGLPSHQLSWRLELVDGSWIRDLNKDQLELESAQHPVGSEEIYLRYRYHANPASVTILVLYIFPLIQIFSLDDE